MVNHLPLFKPYLFFFLLFSLISTQDLYAQCNPGVPTFNVNLTGNPDTTWVSPTVIRNDYCCTAGGADKCVHFSVTLDSMAGLIIFDIASGAIPPGALYYQINCGPPVQVGQPICITGVGPHDITFCKPGNNQNTYSITSISEPNAGADITSSMSCVDTLMVRGYDDTTLVWTSVPFNATHNSYLNCVSLTGCDTVEVVPLPGYPPFVDYEVCGKPAGGCDTVVVCDTVRVYFVNDLDVAIQPDTPYVCAGDSGTIITALGIGGTPPYYYNWSTGDSTASISVTPGTYWVELHDSVNCQSVYDTVTVLSSPKPTPGITGSPNPCAYAVGESYCTSASGNNFTWVVSGGVITTGQGTNCITVDWGPAGAGSVTLTELITSTGCDSTLQLAVNINPKPTPVISGPDSVCEFTTGHVYCTPASGNNFNWVVSGGVITAGQGTNCITVTWNAAGSGTVTLTETIAATGCDTTVDMTVVISPRPNPSISPDTAVCEFTAGHQYCTTASGNNFNWIVSGGIITAGQGTNCITVDWGITGTGTITLTESIPGTGCDTTISTNITINPKPNPVITGPAAVCENTTGHSYCTPATGNNFTWVLTGGGVITAGQGTNCITVSWPTTGAGTVSVTEVIPGSGCDTTVTINVNINPLPTPVITGPLALCEFDTATYCVTNVAGNNYTWVITGGVITAGQGTNCVTVKWATSTSGTVQVTEAVGASGCDSTTSITVTVNPKPTPVITGPDPVCEYTTGHNYCTPASGNNFNWVVSGGVITAGQGTNCITVDWGVNGAGTVSVTESIGATGCDSTVSIPVTINPKPDPLITGPDSVCEYTTGHSYCTVASGNSFNWVVSGGVITAGQGTNCITVTWNAAGAGSVTLTETIAATGCDTTVDMTVVISPRPNPSISPDTSVCEFTAGHQYCTTASGNNFAWVVSGGVITAGQGTNCITVDWGITGTGTITLTESIPGTGCDTTISTNITINPKPNPVITGPAAVCENTTGHSYCTPATGNNFTWVVTGGGVITAGQGTNCITVSWPTTGAGTVSVTEVIPGSGCDTTVTVNVNINPLPTPVITGPLALCEFDTATYCVTNVAGNNYTWVITGGVITAGQGTNCVTVKWATSTSGTVQVTEAVGASGCDSTTSITVTVNPKPTPVITGPDPVCEYTTGHNYCTPASGNNFNWVVSGGTITAGQGTNCITVDWGVNGAGTVSVTESIGATGCDSTVSIPVTINPKPDPLITGADSVCEFTTGHSYCTVASGNSFNWVVSGGVITAGQGTNCITVTWNAAGAGSVTLTETIAATGCDTTVDMTVVISPRPNPSISPDTAICEFTAGHQYCTTASGNNFAWVVSGGVITAGQGTNCITVDWGITGTGTITLTESIPGTGCDTTISTNITINPKPNPVITGPAAVCENTTGHSYCTPATGNNFTWVVTGGGVITAGQGTNCITVSWPSAGAGTVSVTEVIPGSGCDTTVTVNVNVNPLPTPVITGPLALCEYDTGAVYCVTNVAGNNYTWVVTGGFITAGQGTNCITVKWGANGTGTVQVTEAVGASGCDSTVSINVTVDPKPTPAITGPDPVCEYTNGHNYCTPATANSFNWVVSGGVITAGQGTNCITVDWGVNGAGTVTVTEIIGATGCDSTVSIPVTINPKPDPLITGADSVCEFTTGHSYCTVALGNSFNWVVSGGVITAGQGTNCITVTWNAAGAGSVTLTETIPATGCDTTVDMTVVISPRPNPSISPDTAVCEFTAGHQYCTTASGNNFAWVVSGGVITAGQGTNCITVDWGITGTGTITLTESIPGTGCDTTISTNITINPKPNPVITGPAAVCENTTGHSYCTPATGNNFTWVVTGGGVITAGQGTNCITVSWPSAGAGTVSVTEVIPGSGCDTTVTVNVNINPLPTPVITGPLALCEYDTGAVYCVTNVAGNNYTWVVTGGFITAGQGTNCITVKWGANGTGTVQVTEAVGASGCDSTVSINVTVDPKPTPVITGPDPICEYTNGHNYCTPATANSFNWVVSGGVITAGQGTNCITVDWGVNGAGTVSVTESIGATGCDSTVSIPVTINPKPDPLITGPDSVCEYTTGHSYCTVASGNSFNWVVSGGVITAGQGTNCITVTWNAAGAGSVTLTETIAATGCDTTVDMTVVISPKPSPSISGPSPVCEYSGGHQYCTVASGNNFNWIVSGGVITAGQGTNCITVDWGIAGTGTVTLTETIPGTGCDTTVTYNVNIDSKPNPVLSGPTAVCEFTTGHSYCTAASGNTFNWSVSGGTIASGQGTNCITVDWGIAGAGTITLTETMPGTGCDTTITYNININPDPTPLISGPDSVCEYGAGYTYCTPVVAGNTWNWVVTGGVITGGQGTNCITVKWLAAGAGTVEVTETVGASGCDSTVSMNILISPRPAPAITGPDSVCALQGGYQFSVSPNASASYFWAVTGGNITSGQGTSTITVQWGSPGTGTVYFTETNILTGCDSIVSKNIVLNPSPVPQITGPAAVCENDTSVTYCTALSAGNTYYWVATGGTIVGGQGTSCITVDWGAAGQGSVSVVETHPIGCDSTNTFNVMIGAPQTLSFNVSHVSCFGLTDGSIDLTVNGGNNPFTYQWAHGPVSEDVNNLGDGIYVVTVVDSNGCVVTDSATVNEPSPLTVATSATLATCNTNNGTATATPSGGTPGYSYSWNTVPVQTTATAINLWPGTYQVTVTDTNGCTETASVTVTGVPGPVAQITGVTNVTCPGGSDGSASAAGIAGTPPFTFVWLTNPPQNGPAANNLPAGVHAVVMTDSFGCSDTAYASITDPPDFVVTDSVTPVGCNSTSPDGTAMVSVTGGTPGYTYLWNVSPPQTGPLAWQLPVGNVVVTITDSRGCSVNDTIYIPPQAVPTVTAGPDVSFCEGEGGDTIIAWGAGGTKPWWFSWWCNQPICGLDSINDNDPLANPTVTTTYYVQITDFNGCKSNVDSLVVTVLPKPKVNAGPDLYICGDSAPCVQLNPTVWGAPGPYTYTWTPDTFMNNPNIPNPCVRPDTTMIYVLNVTAGNGCTSEYTTVDTQATVTVFVNPVAIADAGPDKEICFGDSIMLYGVGYNAGPNYQFEWSPAAGLSDPYIPNPKASPALTTEYILTVWSNGCPSYGDTMTLTVNALPTVDAGGPYEACEGDSVQLAGQASGAGSTYTYLWWPNIDLSDNTLNNPMAAPDTIRQYYFTAISDAGCEGPKDSATIYLLARPVANAGPDLSICKNESVQLLGSFSLSYVNGEPDTTNFQYYWWPGTAVTDSSIKQPWTVADTAMWYHFTITNGVCSSTDSALITILPTPSVSLTADTTTICGSDSVQLTASGGFGSPNWTWTPAYGLNNPSIYNPMAGPDTTTTYMVILEEGFCSDTASITVEVLPQPVANFISSQTTGCAEFTVDFQDVSDHATGWIWDFGDGSQVSNSSNPTHTYTTAGNYNVTLYVTGQGGCVDSSNSIWIHVIDSVDADFTTIPEIPATLNLPNSEVIFLDGSQNATTWTWDFGDGASSHESNPVHTYSSPGEYFVTLTIENEGGCIGRKVLGPFIVISPDISIPNVFTPNGDGFNDEFFARYSGDQPFLLQIFDRWGNQIFSTNNKHEGWDGRNMYNGNEEPASTYYYIISVGGKEYVGNVTLMR